MDNLKAQCDPSRNKKAGERKPFVTPSLKRFETPRLIPMGRIDSVVLGSYSTGGDLGSKAAS